MAVRHHPDIDLRPQPAPLSRTLAAAVRVVADDRLLRRIVLTGAWSTAVGAAQAAVLIVWLRDDVGLRGALVPALLAGFVAMRIGRPLVLRLAGRARPGTVLTTALAVQAAASLAAYSTHGSLGAASAYALSLAAGASLGILVNRALAASSPPDLAPAVGLASGAAWALAACAGAAAGACLAAGLGLAGTHLVLAALAILGAVAVATRAAAQALVPARGGRRPGWAKRRVGDRRVSPEAPSAPGCPLVPRLPERREPTWRRASAKKRRRSRVDFPGLPEETGGH